MSSTFTAVIRTAGGAFNFDCNGQSAGQELARILRDISENLDDAGLESTDRIKCQTILDINGNRVGQWMLVPDDE